jgi:hypothetical protein
VIIIQRISEEELTPRRVVPSVRGAKMKREEIKIRINHGVSRRKTEEKFSVFNR